VEEFIAWLDSDERTLHWLQNNRIERALTKAGFPTGRVGVLGSRPDETMGTFIGNLAGPTSRFITNRPVVFDEDLQMLAARDLTKTEQLQLRL